MRQAIDIQDLLVWAFRDHAPVTADDPPPDALSVYWAVMALPSPEADLIAHHARHGTLPEWRPDGAPIGNLGEMRRPRALYGEWVASMARLVALLDGTLEGFVVSGPAINEAPWIRERAG